MDSDKVQTPRDTPRAPDEEATEKTHKRQKVSVSEQVFDSAVKDFIERKHEYETGWCTAKGRRNNVSKKQWEEEVSRRRNVSPCPADGVSEDSMELDVANNEHNVDAQARDFLINKAAVASNSRDKDDGAISNCQDSNKDNGVSDVSSREQRVPGATSDTQLNREIFMVCGSELKECNQQLARPSVKRYDNSFQGKAKITLRLPTGQSFTRKGKNLIKIWIILADCRVCPQAVTMTNHFSAEAEFKDYVEANHALETFDNLPEPKKISAFLEQRAMISKGVISDWPSSVRDLWSVVQDKTNIIGLERMYRRSWDKEERKSTMTETDNILVTFKGSGVRDLRIFSNNVGLKVRPFVPQARQCYNCYRFGHTKAACKSETCCIICGDKAHGTCDSQVKCRNCGGPHKSTFRQCPIFVKNKNINIVMAYKNISFYSARRIVEGGDKPTRYFDGPEGLAESPRREGCPFFGGGWAWWPYFGGHCPRHVFYGTCKRGVFFSAA